MGWNELLGWRRELQRAATAEVEGDRLDPESWDGQDRDRWWAEMREKRDRERAT